MRKIIILSFYTVILFYTNSLLAQKNQECGTPSSETDFMKNISPEKIISSLVGTRVLKMYVVIYSDDNGLNQAMSDQDVVNEIIFSNTIYNTAGTCFMVVGIEHRNSTFYNNPSSSSVDYSSQVKPNAFTVFVVKTIGGTSGGTFGWAPTIVASHMITKQAGFGTRRTFIHEMGHALGLEHTFRGYPSDARGCRELVNGSNSTTCGDFIVDTPADPDGLPGATSNNCVYNGTALDANGQLFSPITTNYMSYWANSGCDRSTFSNDQYLRMRNSIDNNSILSSLLIPDNEVNFLPQTYSSGIGWGAARVLYQFLPSLSAIVYNGTANYTFQANKVIVSSGNSRTRFTPSTGGKIIIRPNQYCN